MNRTAFVKDVVRRFRVVKPRWKPPHATIFAAAKRYGGKTAKVTINGKTKAFYDKQGEYLFERVALDDDLTVKVGKEVFHFEWLDCARIREVRA